MPFPTSRPFGILPDGRSVEAWTLSGPGGLEVEVLTYGGIVRRILAPDREGCRADVALGLDTLEETLSLNHYFGAITGRVAGRIPGGKLSIDGKIHPLDLNDGPNHLHGGKQGLDKRRWIATPSENALTLSYCSPDGEEGYPGNLDLQVTYSLTPDNALRIETEAASDRPTPVSLTNHTYFHLGGEGSGSIAEHELQIVSSEIVPINDDHSPLGILKPVDGLPGDFRFPKRLGDVIPDLFLQHGDCYRLTNLPGQPAARVAHPASGRILEVLTDNRYLQLYTAAHFDGSFKGKAGLPYNQYGGLCLECEGYPDALNHPALDDILVRPGSPQKRMTQYKFSAF